MLKTRNEADQRLSTALGEPDAWGAPRWAEKESHSSDYDRAVASLREPDLDLPAGRIGRPQRPLMEQAPASYRAKRTLPPVRTAAELREEPPAPAKAAPLPPARTQSAPAQAAPAQAAPAQSAPMQSAQLQSPPTETAHAQPAPVQSATAQEAPVTAAAAEAAAEVPITADSTLANFYVLARALEEIRNKPLVPLAAAAPIAAPVAAPAPETWLDQLRQTVDASVGAAAPSVEPAPVEAAPAPAPVVVQSETGIARSLGTLIAEVANVAKKSEVTRLQDAVVEVVRRVTMLEARLDRAELEAATRGHRQPDPVQQPARQALPGSVVEPAAAAPAPAVPAKPEPPRRLTVEMIEARIAERRRANEAARRGATAPDRRTGEAPLADRESQARAFAERFAQTPAKSVRDADGAYEPRLRTAPRRLFS
ncbi:hypothetical protein [Acuticoccus sediminis]|uniref:hypothetical protein n=1 Tax=Acuticoccus sediminis TaxID=2184697 RepID=UPI0011B93E25|nr:hypothetical protein [Acuticoccus sediminis]